MTVLSASQTGSGPDSPFRTRGRDRTPRWSGYIGTAPRVSGLTKAERREQEAVLTRLKRDAAVLVHVFGLPLRSLDAERPNVRRRYGVCYSDGEIRIRLRHARTGRPLKYSSLVDTLCHEIAHLRYFHHGPRFRTFYFRLLDYARQRGIYRPGMPPPLREVPPPPELRKPQAVQLELFSALHANSPRTGLGPAGEVRKDSGMG